MIQQQSSTGVTTEYGQWTFAHKLTETPKHMKHRACAGVLVGAEQRPQNYHTYRIDIIRLRYVVGTQLVLLCR